MGLAPPGGSGVPPGRRARARARARARVSNARNHGRNKQKEKTFRQVWVKVKRIFLEMKFKEKVQYSIATACKLPPLHLFPPSFQGSLSLLPRYLRWLGGRMYDVIYFNAWSDIICTAAKLLHGSSAGSRDPPPTPPAPSHPSQTASGLCSFHRPIVSAVVFFFFFSCRMTFSFEVCLHVFPPLLPPLPPAGGRVRELSHPSGCSSLQLRDAFLKK